MGANKKPANGGRDKKDDGKSSAVAVSVEVEMYCGGCEGCEKKIKRVVKHMDGMEDAKVVRNGNKLTVTVTRKVDAAKIKTRLEKEAKKVYIVSHPKKDGGGGGYKKPRKDNPKKASEKPKEPQVEGKKSPKETTKKVDKAKELVAVTETMDFEELIWRYLQDKLRGSKDTTKKKVDKAKELVAVTETMDVEELMWRYLQDKLRGSKDVAPTNKKNKGININISAGVINLNLGK